MRPMIFNQTEHDLRPVLLRLVYDQGDTDLVAVNNEGVAICSLLAFRDESVSAYGGAKNALESKGYDTSFSLWDDHGRLCLNHQANDLCFDH